nr:PaeR7I family type II restriction endonuclease [Longimicrobium terrae]
MIVSFPWTEEELRARVGAAVQSYWSARGGQAGKQKAGGIVTDAGTRSEVTGGQHLKGFTGLLCDLISSAGYQSSELRFKSGVELPGFYRPTKQWDIVVVRNGRLCAAIEMKSQVGPSFGNNFNNRTEEAVGSSTDLWLAFREGLLGVQQPWVGYFFFLEDAPASTKPVKLASSVFSPDEVFRGTSYRDRYEILCTRMVLERNYNAAALITSERDSGGAYDEPSSALGVESFCRALFGHLIGCA